ncbi:methyl-accepting chemotaxis protein [Desulfosudis oleivorans]|uniref:Methyl-accepting chemotaxis sensory transducer n=1 Tax=Desulfosudis oleivorans (strain DSM 6200 / JCM 39069 / Hxd3) TaxID=96561 RepID=A8ZVY0_DESOH|nr:methyl-accepting chemotaxis protein [Desulfosudis oleivorans]ABW66689.1 methyl-accepting chemotaxis sensory transducer [Desulfosudis oleivorans Hxd3]
MRLSAWFKKRPETQGSDLEPVEVVAAVTESFPETGGPDPAPAVLPPEGLRQLSVEIPGIKDEMKTFVDGSEGDFMLLGISLRTIHANVTELTDLMLDTVKQMGVMDKGGFLDRGRRILEASLAEIVARQNEVRTNLERMNGVMDNLETLYAISKQIKKFSQSLKTVALNMLVENARSIDRSVNIFSDVAQEIKDLSVNIAGIANDVHKNVEKARTVHRSTLEEIAGGIGRLETLTAEIRTTVQESTHKTEALLRFSVDTIDQAGRRSREISRQVAEIVVGVQFHDNMRQRMLYVANRLNAVLSAAVDGGRRAPGLIADRKPAPEIIVNQVHRIAGIRTEITEVYEKNRSALERIGHEVGDLVQGISGTDTESEDSDLAAFRHDPFSHLKGALTQLHDLLNRGESFYRQIQEAAAQVSGIAATLSELLGLVRSISANTHNKAINSIIAADRMGERGGALKMLAKEMNALATRSDGLSSEVEQIITAIMTAAGEIRQTEARVAPDPESGAMSRLNQVIQDISMAYEAFQQDSMAAYQRARELKKAVDTTLSSLDFFQGLSRRLKGYSDRLEKISACPGLETVLVDADLEAAGRLPGRHTADRENNVILFEGARKGGREDDNEPVDEGLGTNVELF